MKTEFVKLKLDGSARFNEHTLPLQFARDLAAYEELIVELARELYLAEHAERKRVPRGFGKEFSLHLAGIEEGSAELVLDNVIEPPPEGDDLVSQPQWGSYFEKARNLVEDSIDKISKNEPLSPTFPTRLLVYFDQFGRSLKGEEYFSFPSSNGNSPRYTKQVRRRLTTLQGQFYTDELSLLCLVVEVDASKERFTVELGNGNKVAGPFPPGLYTTAIAAMNAYKERRDRAIVHCVARFAAANDTIQNIEEVEDIELVEFGSLFKRIDYLKTLKAGWLDGEGEAPTEKHLDKLALSFAQNWSEAAAIPKLYPTPTGGISAEWANGSWETSLEMDFTTGVAVYGSLDVSTGEEETFEISLSKPDDWAKVCTAVAKHHPNS